MDNSKVYDEFEGEVYSWLKQGEPTAYVLPCPPGHEYDHLIFIETESGYYFYESHVEEYEEHFPGKTFYSLVKKLVIE